MISAVEVPIISNVGEFDLLPITTRIFIKRSKLTSGSIIIPSTAKSSEMFEGIVLAIGPECHIVSVGDYVIYGKYAGAEITRNGHTVTVINEEDIIGKVKKEVM